MLYQTMQKTPPASTTQKTGGVYGKRKDFIDEQLQIYPAPD